MGRVTLAGRLAAGLVLTMFASAPYAEDSVLSVGYIPDAGLGGRSRALRTCLGRFLEEHPAARVRQFRYVAMPYSLYAASWIMSVTAAAGPDVLALDLDRLGDMAREGLISPVDDLYESFPWKDRQWSIYEDALRIEGKVWGLVGTPAVPLLAGREDVKWGGGPPPATLDDLSALAAKLTTTDRAGLGIPGGTALAAWWAALARSLGAPDPSLDERGRLCWDLASPGAVRAAELVARLGAEIRRAGGRIEVAESSEKLLGPFMGGKIALALLDSYDLIREVDGRSVWTARPTLCPWPSERAGAPVVWDTPDATIRVLPSYLTGAKRQLAWEYLVGVSDLNPLFDQSLLAQIGDGPGLESPDLPARYPDHASTRALPAGWSATLRGLFAAARPLPPWLDRRQMLEVLGPRLEKVLAGEMPHADALAQAQRAYDDGILHLARRTGAGWRAAGWAILGMLGLALAAGLTALVATLRAEARELRSSPAGRLHRDSLPLVLVLYAPGFVLSVVFAAWPLVEGLRLSMRDAVLRDGGRFSGAANWLEAATSPEVHGAAGATVAFMAWSFLFAFLAPFGVAVLVSGMRRFQSLARTMFFLPAVANAVVVALLWEQLYAGDGAANLIMDFLGLARRNWLDDPATAMPAVALAHGWGTLGATALIHLAALSTVPVELYEEAELCGANLWQRFRHVTWPFAAPLLGVTLLGWLIAAARNTEHVLLLTAGGPAGATKVLGLDIFGQAYWNLRFGYALAEVWLLIAVILALAVFHLRMIRRGNLAVAE